MQDPENYDLSADALAAAETELPEWDRLRVRDHWDAVVASELGDEPVSDAEEPERPSNVVSLRPSSEDTTGGFGPAAA